MGQRIARARRERSPRTLRHRLRRARHRWFVWRNYTIHWWTVLWSWAWTRGTFPRRFWTVVIVGLTLYVAADVVVAWLT